MMVSEVKILTAVPCPDILSDSLSSFAFLRFMDLPASEAHRIHISPLMRRRLIALERESTLPDLRYAS